MINRKTWLGRKYNGQKGSLLKQKSQYAGSLVRFLFVLAWLWSLLENLLWWQHTITTIPINSIYIKFINVDEYYEEYIYLEIIFSPLFTAALAYLMNHTDENLNIQEFEKNSGIGVTVSPEEIERVVEKIIIANKNELIEKRYSFNIGMLMGKYI